MLAMPRPQPILADAVIRRANSVRTQASAVDIVSRLACVVLLMLSCFASAHAEPQGTIPVGLSPLHLSAEETAWLAAHPRLRVSTKTEWAPIDLYTYEGQFRGLSGDYLALIAERLGVALEFTPAATLADSLASMQRGGTDLLPSVARTPQRETYMAFSQPYLDVPNVYVARRGVKGVGPSEPMAGLRIAAEKGYGVVLILRERHPQAEIVEVVDSGAALRAVSEGQADAYLGALPTTSFLVEKLLLANLEVRASSHHSQSALHFGVAKGQPLLLSIIDKALSTITLAERQEIHRRWAPLHSLLTEPSPPLALNAAEQRFLSTTPALRVGYEADYRPYTFRTADGQMAGMAADYLRLVADKLGLRIGPPQGGTWSDIFGRARRGELDLLVAVAANDDRRREFLFVGPWMSTPNVLLTRRDAAPVLNLEQYDGRRIAVLRDGQTAYLLARLYPHLQMIEVDSRDDVLAAVTNGVVEAGFVNSTFAAPRLAQGLGGALKMAGFFPELNSDLYFAVRRDQPEIASLLARALASLNDSERGAIAARWAVLPELEDDNAAAARERLRRLEPLLAVLLGALFVSLLWAMRLRREVTRRRGAEAQLALARDRAEALAQAREAFLAEASHEIRTPVNAVVGALDLLGLQPLPLRSRQLAVLAHRAAQTLSEYVNNLLDLSKSDAGQLKLVPQRDSLATALDAAVQGIRPVAQAKGIEVALTLDPRLAPRHVFDAFRLRQVVLNLLSNAVKFGPSGTVELRVGVEGQTASAQQLRIDVTDEGEGIAPEHLERLFRPYVQAGDSRVHREGSSGLGLALCKRLVEAMSGEITMEPNRPRGTRVTVRMSLPYERDGTPDAATHDEVDRSTCRVLLVEDDQVQQIVIEAMLAGAGYVVDVVEDGQAACRAWLTHGHRLVITDMHLPGDMSGVQLARWLRDQPGGGELRLVGISADLDEADTALAAGIERMLQKPLSPASITEALQSISPAEARRG
jgi:two-component system sensor histidine kinase EvgS